MLLAYHGGPGSTARRGYPSPVERRCVIFLPVTRTWSMSAVVMALRASDVPRKAIVLHDAPGTRGWDTALEDAGFEVQSFATLRDVPPTDPIERRQRHLSMRKATQELVRGYGKMLFLEDDTLVPGDVWSRLSSYDVASGVQVSRHSDLRACGAWMHRGPWWVTVYDDEKRVLPCDATGHYCLMVNGDAYANVDLDPKNGEAIDRAHTRKLGPVMVDFGCECGHLTPDGVIGFPPLHTYGWREGGRTMREIRTPSGPFWPDMHGPDHDPNAPLDELGIYRTKAEEAPVIRTSTEMYRTREPIVVNGVVVVPRHRNIKMAEALKYAKLGAIDDPTLIARAIPPHDPRTDTQDKSPVTATKATKCQGATKSGKPCKRKPSAGSAYCSAHG